MGIAEFKKVSYEQFEKDWLKCFPFEKDNIHDIYEEITLPHRATKGSAGYDFVSPKKIVLAPQETVLLPTGIRARINDGFVLMLFPRSSLGFKYRMQLNNTVGVIDSDYYDADNEGHIMCKITNDTNENRAMTIEAHQGFVQGIFLAYGVVDEDSAEETRTGGFGSTDKK